MKRALKILGVLLVIGLIGGLGWYFQSLKIEGDAALKSCWAVDIIDDFSGEKVVGAEDLDFDYESGTIFLSAYDRRAVAREIKAGKVTTQGGIYTLKLDDIHQTGVLPVHDISREFKEAGNEFRPHGFVFVPERFPEMIAINRLYRKENGTTLLAPEFVGFEFLNGAWNHTNSVEIEGVCDPYDVLKTGGMLIPMLVFTDVSGKCKAGKNDTVGELKIYAGDTPQIILDELSFPNGLVGSSKFTAVSQTRDNSIIFLKSDEIEDRKIVSVPVAPDNLTVDENDNLYVTGFPNLLDYYFYMKEWFGVKKSPSVAYRIAPDTYEQTLLYNADGTMISGATTALRAGDYLILSSGWDDHIAICSGMNGLD